MDYRDRSRGGRAEYAKLAGHSLLTKAIAERGETNRSLAARVLCHHSMISHLRSGRKRTCTVALATSIEEALGERPGSIFMPMVSSAY